MSQAQVAAFTDTYLPTINGVTYTVRTWRDCWESQGGRMDVIYPGSRYTPEAGEHPVGSIPLPFYDGFRIGTPRVPESVRDVDLVHAHTPFGLGLAALRLARSLSVPLIASYHTPTAEYAGYLTDVPPVEGIVRDTAASYENWFLEQAETVVVPSETTAETVESRTSGNHDVEVVSNGVDTSLFEPTDVGELRKRYALPEDELLVGYTGRHGHEKELETIVDAVASLDRDVTLVFGGDGPARDRIETRSRDRDVEAEFLGFLDRSELPAFYSLLDVFAFPSPVETQGLVALEAIACGTPVAGVDAGGLRDSIDDGETGFTAPPGETAAFRAAIAATLEDRDRLRKGCLDKRPELSVERSIDRLDNVYTSLLQS